MFSISDYKMAESILRSICDYHSVKFINIEIKFDEDDKIGFIDGKIFIGNPKNLALALYRIISICIENFDNIYNKNIFCDELHRFNLLNAIFNYLKKISSIDNKKELVWQRLYQQEVVWTIMKDIICPAFDIEIDNCLIALYSTPWVDVACYSKDKNFILLNTDIENDIIKQAALLCSVIKFYGLNPRDVISEIDNTEIMNKIEGVAKLSFKDNSEVLDFIVMLKVFAGLKIDENWKILSDRPGVKTAQTSGSADSWWFLGIIEKLLEPARGSDWSTYKALEPYYQEVQDKIDKARAKSGREGLTYEALLRTISGEVKPEDIKLIERNLASDRIW